MKSSVWLCNVRLITSSARGTLTGPDPGSHNAGSPLASKQRSWTAMKAQRAATLSSARAAADGGFDSSADGVDAGGTPSATHLSSSSATNCWTVAEAVFLMVAERDCCKVKQRRRSWETVVSEYRRAGELAMVSTVCSTLSSEFSSADGSCDRAISCEVTVGSR